MDASNNAIGWGLTALLVGSTLNVVGDCFLIATEEQRKEMRPGWHGFACLLGLAAGALAAPGIRPGFPLIWQARYQALFLQYK